MKHDTLVTYFEAAYDKRELANILADVISEGIIPQLPPDEAMILVSSGVRGRPAGRDMAATINLLVGALDRIYPTPTTLSRLSKTTPMSYRTIIRLQQQHADLLPTYLKEYFLMMPRTESRVHISPIWRAVLDLHNYVLLVKAGGGTSLPLYMFHASMWGQRAVQIAVVTKRLNDLNASERTRATNPVFTQLLCENDWPQIHPTDVVDEYKDGCLDGCSVLQAYSDGASPQTVGDAHLILFDSEVNLPLSPHYNAPLKYGKSFEVVRQLVEIG